MKLSCEATASHRPLGENFKSEIVSRRCFFATSSFPVAVSNTMNPPPWNPHATRVPSGEYVALRALLETLRTAICRRWYMSKTRSVLSSPAVTNCGRNGCAVKPRSSHVCVRVFSSVAEACPCVTIRRFTRHDVSVDMSNSKISEPFVPTSSCVPSRYTALTQGVLPS